MRQKTDAYNDIGVSFLFVIYYDEQEFLPVWSFSIHMGEKYHVTESE